MTEMIVVSKGCQWVVHADGTIEAPPHTTTYTRTRRGEGQTFTCEFGRRRLSPYKGRRGYLEVAAQKGGIRVKETVHRLVGMAFVPGYAEGLTINHINGVKTDNRPENLEWVSRARNTRHQWETGLVDLRGERAPGSKLTSKQVVYIRKLLSRGVPAHTLAVIADVSPSTIAFIRDGKRWARS